MIAHSPFPHDATYADGDVIHAPGGAGVNSISIPAMRCTDANGCTENLPIVQFKDDPSPRRFAFERHGYGSKKTSQSHK